MLCVPPKWLSSCFPLPRKTKKNKRTTCVAYFGHETGSLRLISPTSVECIWHKCFDTQIMLLNRGASPIPPNVQSLHQSHVPVNSHLGPLYRGQASQQCRGNMCMVWNMLVDRKRLLRCSSLPMPFSPPHVFCGALPRSAAKAVMQHTHASKICVHIC